MNLIEEMNNSYQNKDNFTNNINELEKNLNELSKINPQISTVQNKKSSSNSNSTCKNLIEGIRDNLFPYPNIDEIPEIKIKDQDHFQSNEEIQFYKNFDDSKFNKCKSCGKNDNKIFCEN